MRILSLLLILGPSLYFGYLGKPTEMGLSIVGGAVASAFLNLEKFDRFKGAGFEAEMRRVASEASATLENLKDVAKPLCRSALAQLINEGRIGGMDLTEKTNYKNEIVSLAKGLNIYDEGIESQIHKFDRYHIWDLYQNIEREIPYDETSIKNEIRNKVDRSLEDYPARDGLLDLFVEHGIKVEGKLKEAIENYTYFLEHRLPKE